LQLNLSKLGVMDEQNDSNYILSPL